MREDLTFIAVVLDRSGSMQSKREATINGFNDFLREQKAHPGKALFTLVQFDHEYEIVYDGVDISNVKDLSAETFVPRGSTALLDAMGRTIVSVGAKLSGMQESERPGRVIMLTLTDGFENASREHTQVAVTSMVEHQKNKYGWKFVFLGADPTAAKLACDLGVQRGNVAMYSNNAIGTKSAFANTSKGLGFYRSAASVEAQSFNFYSEEDKIGVIPEDASVPPKP